MPKCKMCNAKEAKKDGLCADCWPKQKKKDEEKLKVQKQIELEKKKLADKQAEMKEAAAKQLKNQQLADAKKSKIPQVAAAWNTQIKGLVDNVESLRAKNPGKTGINAGKNQNVIPTGGGNPTTVTIAGGTDNPLALTMPSDAAKLGIEKRDVLSTISGFQSSDSGLFKFRRGKNSDVFIHCK